jgi:hypothetical protein
MEEIDAEVTAEDVAAPRAARKFYICGKVDFLQKCCDSEIVTPLETIGVRRPHSPKKSAAIEPPVGPSRGGACHALMERAEP